MVDATSASVAGCGLGVPGRIGVPAAMAEPSGPVRRAEAPAPGAAAPPTSPGRTRPSAVRPRSRARAIVASTILDGRLFGLRRADGADERLDRGRGRAHDAQPARRVELRARRIEHTDDDR